MHVVQHKYIQLYYMLHYHKQISMGCMASTKSSEIALIGESSTLSVKFWTFSIIGIILYYAWA